METNSKKYYVFTYRDGAGGGRRYILAADRRIAERDLRRFLNEHHPFRRFIVELEQVLTAN